MRQGVLVVLTAAALGGATAARAQSAPSFATYVSIGDSLAAGVSNGTLLEKHQRSSVPALIARQAGVSDFQMPLVAEPGIPPELALVSLLPGPVIAPKSATPGAPTNLALPRPYSNLAVPGATTIDALSRTTDDGGAVDLVLRHQGTQVAQALALHPTFVTVWIGNNDVLGAVISGRAVDGVTLVPTDAFRAAYGQIITALKGSGARVVAANIGDVTTLPYVTTIKPYVVNPATQAPVLVNGQNVPLLGPTGPLPASAAVTLAAASLLAQGIGIPAELGGRGTPLPGEVILDASELAVIRDHVSVDNAAIAEICSAASVPVVDVHALLAQAATTGLHVGGITLSSAFLSGGLFGLDGVHPTDLGYAVIANEWIRVIDGAGGAVPPLDLRPFFGVSAGGPVRAAAQP